MIDNIQQEYIRNYRQKGIHQEGRIFKGLINEACRKMHVATIPSKFETIIYKINFTQAFGSANPRFSTNLTKETVSSSRLVDLSANSCSNPSFSKNGNAGFVNSEKRLGIHNKFVNSGPGPGQYDVVKNFLREETIQPIGSFILTKKKNSSNDVNRIIVNKAISPGPCDYNPKINGSPKCHKNVFISKTNRSSNINL